MMQIFFIFKCFILFLSMHFFYLQMSHYFRKVFIGGCGAITIYTAYKCDFFKNENKVTFETVYLNILLVEETHQSECYAYVD